MTKITLPELGEGIDQATVACIHFRQGDTIEQEDDLLEVVTDKATFNVPAGTAGVVKEILVKEHQEVKIGETLALIEP